MSVRKGDLVLFGRWSGCQIEEEDGKELRIVRLGEIMGVARGKAHAS
jgi:co-chaperonin GroES (HSP10)